MIRCLVILALSCLYCANVQSEKKVAKIIKADKPVWVFCSDRNGKWEWLKINGQWAEPLGNWWRFQCGEMEITALNIREVDYKEFQDQCVSLGYDYVQPGVEHDSTWYSFMLKKEHLDNGGVKVIVAPHHCASNVGSKDAGKECQITVECPVQPKPKGDKNVCNSWEIDYSVSCDDFPPLPGPNTGTGKAVHPSADEMKQILNEHNKYRAQVGAVAMHRLTWDESLYPIAKEAATRCAVDKNGTLDLVHTKGLKNVGENLFGCAVDIPFVTAVEDWVRNEKACYEPPGGIVNDSCTGECGHYTQAVWANTKKVACAKGYCGSRGMIIACNYGPAGNRLGQPVFKLGTPGSECGTGDFGAKGEDGLCV